LVKIVGVGALNWDKQFIVDRLPIPGEEIVIKSFNESAGGSAANTIAALSRIGVKCGFIGRVGDDSVGEQIMGAFRDEGVDTSGIVKVPGISGTVLAFIDSEGERTMYVDSGVNHDVSLDDISFDYINKSEIVHMSSFAGATSQNTITKIPAHLENVRLSFAPGFLSWRGREFLKPILDKSTILFLNEKEAEALTSSAHASEAGKVLRDEGVEKVVITLGAEGCLLLNKEGVQKVEGEKVKARDTTGAGDALAAGFLYGDLRGYNDFDSVRIGNFVASRCVQQIGARKGLPDSKVMKAFEKTLH
jgi:ribokinase